MLGDALNDAEEDLIRCRPLASGLSGTVRN